MMYDENEAAKRLWDSLHKDPQAARDFMALYGDSYDNLRQRLAGESAEEPQGGPQGGPKRVSDMTEQELRAYAESFLRRF